MPTATPLRTLAAATLLVVLLVAACGGPDGTASPTPSPTASAPASSATSAPSAPVPPASVVPSVPAGDRPDLANARVRLEPVVGGLDAPLFVTAVPDGSGRLYVAGQGGVIRVVRDGRLDATPFLDISDRVSAGGERGLLGVAFPPAYGPERNVVYVHYSDRDGNTTVSAFTTEAGAGTADPASERLVLAQDQPYPNHNGGWIGFDADGMLLVALGDGGAGGDPENRASDLGTLLGKILRVDVLGAGSEPYAIPEDNPFVGRDDARPEILHLGLRNPFRNAVDLETGDLWIGDVGQDAWEELDVARAGAVGLDFGWRRFEGRHCYDRAAGCDEAGVTMPVTEYPHAEGCSVIGGPVYRGDAIPALRGAALFGDFCSGRLWALDAGLDAAQAPILLAETGVAISSIGTGEDGEVYVTDLAGGQLLRLEPAPSP